VLPMESATGQYVLSKVKEYAVPSDPSPGESPGKWGFVESMDDSTVFYCSGMHRPRRTGALCIWSLGLRRDDGSRWRV